MKMRYLKPNKNTTLPTEVCFLGVAGRREHVPGDNDHDMVYLDSYMARFTRFEGEKQTRSTELYSTDPSKFWSYLDGRSNSHHSVMVFAYDVTSAVTLLGLWRQLDQGIYHRGAIIDSDPPVIININSCVGHVRFIDVRNYFSMSLDELAASFGVNKMTAWVHNGDDVTSYQEARYNEQVAEVSITALMSFVRQHNCGHWRSTIALQAMQCYRHRFAPRQTKVTFGGNGQGSLAPTTVSIVFPLMHDNKDIKDFERSANYSGHDECFFVGTVRSGQDFFHHLSERDERGPTTYLYGPVYHVDCNSLYPYVMREARYPCRFVGERNECTLDHLETLMSKYCVIARVLLETENDTFPVRYKHGVIYCTGTYWTTLAARELQFAHYFGLVKKVGYHVCYETMDLFSSYVDYFYRLKVEAGQNKDTAMRLIAKMLLNTLQGKFSQRAKHWREAPDVKAIYRWGKWHLIDYDAIRWNEEHCKQRRGDYIGPCDRRQEVYHYRSIAGQSQVETIDDEVGYSLPAIGACVTANARNLMAGVRELCGPKNVLYQGTDSLLLLEPGYSAMVDAGLIHQTNLGAFRLKGTYDHAVIRNLQDYELGGQRTTRGLPRGARVVTGNAYTFDHRQTLQGMLQDVPAQQIRYTMVERTFDSIYCGGTVGSDGWVTPYRLNYAADRGDAWEGDFTENTNATS
jgi:DNA polymerase type B, organellar and viral